MKTLCLALAASLALAAPLPAATTTNDLAATLKQGLLEEEANRNLKAAISAYQSVVTRFDQDRKTAATALYRLGECYRKLGRTNDALAQFERVVREFADDTVLAQLSRNNLDALRPPAPPSDPFQASPAAFASARAEQQRLFAEEIRLATLELETLRRQFAAGATDQASLLAKEREVLRLRREAAALDRFPDLLDLNLSPAPNQPPAPEPAPGQPLPGAPAQEPAAGDTAEEDAEIRRIQALVQNSPDLINALAKDGLAPLHTAASRGHRLVVQYLLDHGADPNRKSARQETPLHLATLAGHNAVARLLLAAQADVHAADRHGNTALHIAAQYNFKTVADTLLQHAANPNATTQNGDTPLHHAAGAGSVGLAELLIARGATVDALTENGHTPLHHAAAQNSPALVNLLLQHGANVNARTRTGETPLLLAVTQQARAAISSLLAHHADPNLPGLVRQPDSQGRLAPNRSTWRVPPLTQAVALHDRTVAQTLLAAQAQPDAVADQENRPLILAIAQRQEPLVALLLEHKADPNAPDRGGLPPLSLALDTGSTEIVQHLLKAGANPNAPDPEIGTPLLRAVGAGQTPLVQLLLQHGANANVSAPDGNTALHQAIHTGQPTLVTLLLEHNANINARNREGQTPLEVLRIVSSAAPSGLPPFLRPSTLGRPLPPPSSRPQVAPPTPSTPPADLEALLRAHGARDDLPHWDRMTVKRPTASFSRAVFLRQTNDWSRYTLLDLLAVQYGLLAPFRDPSAGPTAGFTPTPATGPVRYNNSILSSWHVANAFGERTPLPYPDLARLVIHRPSTNGTWSRLPTDALALLEAPEGCQDVDLAWGDEVEIPEQDHPLNEPWPGFSLTALRTLQRCLTRSVHLACQGQTGSVQLGPALRFADDGSFDSLLSNQLVSLQQALSQSKLVRASSDLSRVLIRRAHPAPGAPAEWTVDASDSSPQAHLWLRDGDVIQIPDRETRP